MVIRLAALALILVTAETVQRGIVGRIVFQSFCKFEEVIEEFSEFLLTK